MNATLDLLHNATNQSIPPSWECATEIPRADVMIDGLTQTHSGLVILVTMTALTVLTWAIYLDEVCFIMAVFNQDLERRGTTIWILGLFPAYSTSGLAGLLIPRSGCFVDLAASVFMALVIYALLILMVNYLGGPERMGAVMRSLSPIPVPKNTLPLCCCCVCCPAGEMNNVMWTKIRYMVLQFAVIRPLLMFTMGVLWTNSWYQPGVMHYKSSALYLMIINLTTTLIGVWGVNIAKGALTEILAEFKIKQKLVVVMLALLTTVFAPIIMGIVATLGFVGCTPYTTRRGQADFIYRIIIIIAMFLFGVLARFLYKNPADTHQLAALVKLSSEAEQKKKANRGSVIYPVMPSYSINQGTIMRMGPPGMGRPPQPPPQVNGPAGYVGANAKGVTAGAYSGQLGAMGDSQVVMSQPQGAKDASVAETGSQQAAMGPRGTVGEYRAAAMSGEATIQTPLLARGAPMQTTSSPRPFEADYDNLNDDDYVSESNV